VLRTYGRNALKGEKISIIKLQTSGDNPKHDVVISVTGIQSETEISKCIWL